MTRAISVALICVITAGCGSGKQEEQPVRERQVFSTTDFVFRMSPQWSFVKGQSTLGRAVFEAPENDAQLTVSVMQLDTNVSTEVLQESFRDLVDQRRRAEVDAAPGCKHTPYDVVLEGGNCYTKYAGAVSDEVRCTATLVVLKNHKLFTVFVERDGIDAEALNDVATEVYANFRVKEAHGADSGGGD